MNATILIIEDDHFLSSILKSRLEKESFKVLQAFDGNEGLEVLKNKHPELILLDLILPGVSGFEVLETLGADPATSDIPVIVVSNLGQEADIQKAKELGAVDYYVKVRTSIDDLAKVAKNLIAKRGGTVAPGPAEEATAVPQ